MSAEEAHTWADGYGNWHARAADEATARKAIRDELVARDAIGKGYRVRLELVEPGHWAELDA